MTLLYGKDSQGLVEIRFEELMKGCSLARR